MKRLLLILTVVGLLAACSERKYHTRPRGGAVELLREVCATRQVDHTLHIIDSLELVGEMQPPVSDYWRGQVYDMGWRYWLAAGRYDEAVTFMNRIDTLSPASERPRMTLDIIFERMVPRYEAQLVGGYKSEALETATEIFQAIDSVRMAQKHSDAAELAVIYEMNQKDRTLEQKEATERLHLIVISGLLLVLAIGGIALWRVMLAKQKLHEKYLQLFDTVRQMTGREQQTELQLQACPQEKLTAVQKLYLRICQLMDCEKPFTKAELSREELAQMLGTNYKYVADAIRECSDGMTINDFLNYYRLSYAAKLLTTTDDAVIVIADLAGFNNRSYFNRLFRERYKLTPTEYRKVSKEKV